MDNIAILHLVDGTEIIAGVYGRSDGQLGVLEPRRITFKTLVDQQAEEEQVSWNITSVHPLQNVVLGFQPLQLVRGDNVLYSIPTEALPAQLVAQYRALVAQQTARLEALRAQQQQQAQQAAAAASDLTEDTPTTSEAVPGNDGPGATQA